MSPLTGCGGHWRIERREKGIAMGQVSVRINGRAYPIACDDGQEGHLIRLAEFIDKRIGQLSAAVGQADEMRLLVMASLLVADELWDAQAELENARRDMDGSPARAAAAAEDAAARRLERIAERIEQMAASLGRLQSAS